MKDSRAREERKYEKRLFSGAEIGKKQEFINIV